MILEQYQVDSETLKKNIFYFLFCFSFVACYSLRCWLHLLLGYLFSGRFSAQTNAINKREGCAIPLRAKLTLTVYRAHTSLCFWRMHNCVIFSVHFRYVVHFAFGLQWRFCIFLLFFWYWSKKMFCESFRMAKSLTLYRPHRLVSEKCLYMTPIRSFQELSFFWRFTRQLFGNPTTHGESLGHLQMQY